MVILALFMYLNVHGTCYGMKLMEDKTAHYAVADDRLLQLKYVPFAPQSILSST